MVLYRLMREQNNKQYHKECMSGKRAVYSVNTCLPWTDANLRKLCHTPQLPIVGQLFSGVLCRTFTRVCRSSRNPSKLCRWTIFQLVCQLVWGIIVCRDKVAANNSPYQSANSCLQSGEDQAITARHRRY